MMKNNTPFIFFGTPEFAVFTLQELETYGFSPALVITAPDKKAGRGLNLSPPPVKVWAKKNNIPVLQPEKLDDTFISQLEKKDCTLGIVAAYGKILPQKLLSLFSFGLLNIHPSLLPMYRGPSPLEAPILAGDMETGVSIMLVDELMDHGPIIAQEKVLIEDKNKYELAEELFRTGGNLLTEAIPKWIAGNLKSKKQDESNATYTKKITKEEGLLDLQDDPKRNWRKFRAYYGWPGTYFFTEKKGKNIRIKISEAAFENGTFIIKTVIPEGKNKMDYKIFLQSD